MKILILYSFDKVVVRKSRKYLQLQMIYKYGIYIVHDLSAAFLFVFSVSLLYLLMCVMGKCSTCMCKALTRE